MHRKVWIAVALIFSRFAGAAGADSLVLDNPYVRVTRNAAPCASAGPKCGDRVLVALGPVELKGTGKAKTLARGDVAVFRTGEPYTPPATGEFLEVAVKPERPAVAMPPARIPPEKNTLLFEGEGFLVFEEKLAPGESRPRHSHAQRVVVVLNQTRLQQWPDGAPELFRDQIPDDVRFNPPVVHVVKNVGANPLRNVVIELKGPRPFKLPPGLDRIDSECELAVVVGRRAHHVPVERAREHVFGYTLENDVSDRGGRGDSRHGSDWLVGKAHDSFAPLGPFIVPKEFIPDPHKLGIKFTLSGTLMQDSSTERMTHGVDEMLHYASNILTLQPGDVISTGSPAGVGSARNPPIFMKPRDVAVCAIEGIGTLTNPVAAAERWGGRPPRGGTACLTMSLAVSFVCLSSRAA